ncbi:MAG: molybdate ABC transporter substrate-binding protein [Gammaproteobacteria bacterium]|nr:molybdate ABC transporter substrate-binding protein [Gammaproteobacteria bacterium]
MIKQWILPGLVVCGLCISPLSWAEAPVRIAVAANFLTTMKTLAKEFNAQTGLKVSVSNGASGLLYAQIIKGAPYDVFFSADTKRPKRLEQAGLIEPGSRFTYVTGKLVAWSPDTDTNKLSAELATLDVSSPQLRFVAIANPKTAPYGAAAVQVLTHYGLYEPLSATHKIAIGENIGKAYQYVATGNAQIGLVAKSYVSNPKRPVSGQVFDIPPELYTPISQQAVVLKGRNRPAVQAFLDFFHSPSARARIQAYGYGLVPLSLDANNAAKVGLGEDLENQALVAQALVTQGAAVPNRVPDVLKKRGALVDDFS